MTKIYTIAFFFLFIITTPLHAEGPNYGMCGARPGMINRLFTDAEKIRIKCIEDAYQANKEKVRKEKLEEAKKNKHPKKEVLEQETKQHKEKLTVPK